MSKFFCPGRIELAGNHTDRQKGRVMAAAVEKGITAEAEPNGENVIRVFSHGFEPVQVDLMKLWPEESDVGSSASLVRGMAGILSEQIPELRGFDAFLTTDLAPGGGLGSSAAYAVVIGCMIAYFAGGEGLPPQELARAAQKAENRFFGKQSGLTDQMACALGGGVYMDLLEGKILPINCDFEALGLTLCLTDTGGRLQEAKLRSAAAEDMSAVARSFGEQFLAKVRASDFDEVWPEHRDEIPWRRARYFFDETWRVSAMADALGLQDAGRYLELMNESGRSVEGLLRNSRSFPYGPELSLGLEISSRLLTGRGAWRVHSGGSTGRIQALMPQEDYPRYRDAMEEHFGPDCCQRIQISAKGVGLIEP